MPAQRIFHELLTVLDQGRRQINPASAPPPSLLRRTLPLDLSVGLQALLHPTNRLIYTPQAIDRTLLQPFVDGTKDVILVCTRNSRALPATLQALRPSSFIVDTQQSLFRRKRGDAVLVVFPVSPQQQYVLQTVIQQIYAFRVELTCRDPRYDVRHSIPLATQVPLQRVPTTLLKAIAHQQGHMVREITLTPRDPYGVARSVVQDLFCPTETAPAADSLETDTSPLACTLRDLSLGGACLTVDTASISDALRQRLVRLTIPLPQVSHNVPEWASVALTLHILSVVRGINSTSCTSTVHIRFLKRLLPEIDTLLWYLAGAVPDQPQTKS